MDPVAYSIVGYFLEITDDVFEVRDKCNKLLSKSEFSDWECKIILDDECLSMCILFNTNNLTRVDASEYSRVTFANKRVYVASNDELTAISKVIGEKVCHSMSMFQYVEYE